MNHHDIQWTRIVELEQVCRIRISPRPEITEMALYGVKNSVLAPGYMAPDGPRKK